MRVALGCDHAGFALKSDVVQILEDVSASVIDCGADSDAPSDFPLFATRVAEAILVGRADRGILLCGSGVGVSVAANKFPGIRAGVCHDSYSAHQGVEHDDMNVLCIGTRVIGPELAADIVKIFLSAKYQPAPRHARRVQMIADIEQRVQSGQILRAEK